MDSNVSQILAIGMPDFDALFIIADSTVWYKSEFLKTQDLRFYRRSWKQERVTIPLIPFFKLSCMFMRRSYLICRASELYVYMSLTSSISSIWILPGWCSYQLQHPFLWRIKYSFERWFKKIFWLFMLNMVNKYSTCSQKIVYSEPRNVQSKSDENPKWPRNLYI